MRRALVLSFVLSIPLAALGSIPDAAGVYTGCYLRDVGVIRLIDPARQVCTRLEAQLTWSAKGPPGASVTALPVAAGDPRCPFGGARFVSQGQDTYACSGAPGTGTFHRYLFAAAACMPVGPYSNTGGSSGCFVYDGGENPPCVLTPRASGWSYLGSEYACRLDLPVGARITGVTVKGRGGASNLGPDSSGATCSRGSFQGILWRTDGAGQFPDILNRETIASGDTTSRAGLDDLPLAVPAGTTVADGWDYVLTLFLASGTCMEPPNVRGILVEYSIP